MQSFLITGLDKEAVLAKARAIAKEHEIDPFDFSVIEDEKTFGIDTFRKNKDQIFLKPIRGANKIVVLDLWSGATIEAQNAMLKVLEEPPESTMLAILGKKKDYFLPTIVSRCQIIEIKDSYEVGEGKEFEDLLSSHMTKKFVAAQDLSKDKEKALEFIKEAVLYLREKMRKEAVGEEAKRAARMIRELEKAYYSLSETNINPRMVLENLLLSL